MNVGLEQDGGDVGFEVNSLTSSNSIKSGFPYSGGSGESGLKILKIALSFGNFSDRSNNRLESGSLESNKETFENLVNIVLSCIGVGNDFLKFSNEGYEGSL